MSAGVKGSGVKGLARSRLIIFWNLGLGDAIACRPIVKRYTGEFKSITLGAKAKNIASVQALFADLPSVNVVSLGESKPELMQKRLKRFASVVGIPTLSLGEYGEGFLEPPYPFNFDENFYVQAGVPFTERVEAHEFPRDIASERELEATIRIEDEDFCFVHEDPARGLVLDKGRLPRGIQQVHSNDYINQFPITAWVGVLMRAKELHVIESSFSALIESINPPGRKVAHRYARPLVLEKPEMEWTYQTEWTIER